MADFDEGRRDAFAERLFMQVVAVQEVLAAYLGERLGLYAALEAGGGSTSSGLAARAGIDERYAREWLEQQAVAGVLEVDDAASEPGARRYSLPAEHREVLLDRTSLAYMAPFIRLVTSTTLPLDQLAEAFRSGGGVPWTAFGLDGREGQSDANRPVFERLLPGWLASMPDVHAKLFADGARIADIACGGGWSSIAMARAYPSARVDGYELDKASVELARRNAAEAGLSARVEFHLADASAPDLEGRYDLVTVFEALHDMSRPVEALDTMRRLAGPEGAVIVVDERVAERFTAPGDELERMMYGWSVLMCLPAGMAEQPSTGTGTVLRPETLRAYASNAGFSSLEVLPIEHDFFRVYRLYS